jgi:hypothetical protein
MGLFIWFALLWRRRTPPRAPIIIAHVCRHPYLHRLAVPVVAVVWLAVGGGGGAMGVLWACATCGERHPWLILLLPLWLLGVPWGLGATYGLVMGRCRRLATPGARTHGGSVRG